MTQAIWCLDNCIGRFGTRTAGHSDINTTKKYYLSVSESDAKTARREQKKLLGELKGGDPNDLKPTPRAQKREFPGRRQFKPLTEVDEL